MKKTFLALLVVCITMTGCMKDPEPDRTAAGRNLLSLGKNYSDMTLDVTNVAFRLNALMAAAKGTGGAADTLDLNTLKTKNKTILFANATFTREGNVITIHYGENYIPLSTNDIERCGDVIINTEGKLLQEASALWTVLAATQTSSVLSHGDYYHKWSYYTLQNSVEYVDVSITGFTTYTANMTGAQAEWNGNFRIKPYSMTDMSYAVINDQNCTILAGSRANGNLLGTSIELEYDIEEDLVYAPSCGLYFIKSGKEVATSIDLSIQYPKIYPSPSAELIWSSTTTASCQQIATLNYNGYTINL